MQVHGAAVSQEGLAPHPLVDPVPVQGHILILQKEQQQVILLGRQGHGLLPPAHHPGDGVHPNVRGQLQNTSGLAAAAQHRLHPGQQLHELKGLGDVVLRSQPQAPDPVLERSLGSEKDHRHVQRPAVVQQLIAVYPRQHDVQQGQVKGLLLQTVRRRGSVPGPDAVVPRPLQSSADQLGDGGLVLGDQDLVHGTHLLQSSIHQSAIIFVSFSLHRPGKLAESRSPP